MAGMQDFDRTPLLLSKTQRRLHLLPLMAGSGHQNDDSGEPWTLSTVGTNDTPAWPGPRIHNSHSCGVETRRAGFEIPWQRLT